MMRWKPPSDRTQFILLSPVLAPILLISAAMLAIVFAGAWPFVKAVEFVLPVRDWHEWFAWRPVRIVDWKSLESRWYWLETIERRRHTAAGGSFYRLPVVAA